MLSEIQATCDRVLVINNGKIVADDTPENLSKNIADKNQLIASIKGGRTNIKNVLSKNAGVKKATPLEEVENGVFSYSIASEQDKDIRQDVFQALSKSSLPLLSLQQKQLNLEDIFLQLTNENATEQTSDTLITSDENLEEPQTDVIDGGNEE